jgi:glycosyltransferase involved in cell wall biosynthesis
MEVIPMNGVDVTFFAPHATTRRVFRGQDLSDKLVISFIGAIGKRKGLDVLVLAFARLVQSVPHAQLVIAGSGEYDAELARRIEEAGISRSVTRHAWLDDMGVRDLLSVSDVFVYPSIEYGGWAEQFGYSMAEAMSMQVPVVSTHTGSIADVCAIETGILVAPANVQRGA